MNPVPKNGSEDERERRLRSYYERFADWLFQQTFTAILLVVVIFMLGWLAHYTITYAVPAHLNQIQAGYEKIQADAAKAQHELLERMKDDREADRRWASMEREKDRSEWIRVLNRRLMNEAAEREGKIGAGG